MPDGTQLTEQSPVWQDVTQGPIQAAASGLNDLTALASNRRQVRKKQYEFTDHLGNVSATISDRRLNFGLLDSSEVLSANTYWPFGMQLSTFKRVDTIGYRYSFNGQEKSDEIHGEGNHTTAQFWEYDTRLGRRWNLDPVFKEDISNYSILSNNPILMIDPKGDDDYTVDGDGNIKFLKKVEGSETDRLIANWGGRQRKIYDKESGDIRENKAFVEIDKGILDNKKELNIGQENSYFDFSRSPNDASKFFEFVANHSGVEWSKVEVSKNPKGKKGVKTVIVGTTHDYDEEKVGGSFLKVFTKDALKYNFDVDAVHTHSHPIFKPKFDNTILRPSDKDHDFRDMMKGLLGKDFKAILYDEGQYKDYTNEPR